MRRDPVPLAIALCLCFCLLARAEDSDQNATGRSDQRLLQGTWKVVKRVKNGTAEDVEDHPSTLKIDGKKITESRDGAVCQEGTFTLDDKKTPKRITLKGTSGASAGKTFEAIYELDGKTLKLAYSFGDNAATPPKDFSGGEGAGLLVLERQE